VVSVLATGPKVRGFKPGRGRWILRVIKSAARRSHVVDLRHVKEPYDMIDARRQNSAAMFLTRVSSASPLDVCWLC
jgi:hypothetical protein